MTLKKIKIIDAFLTFALCFLTHFIYSWFPNTLFSIFFPVNESIWEHMKMLFTSLMIITFFDYLFFKKWNIKYNNLLANSFICSLTSIPIFLTIYLPFYQKIGESMSLNLIVLFIVGCISQIISYFILKNKHSKYFNYLSLLGIIICYIVFAILTYYPLENDLFFDPIAKKYGIHHYVI